jgi:hypothetical protein
MSQSVGGLNPVTRLSSAIAFAAVLLVGCHNGQQPGNFDKATHTNTTGFGPKKIIDSAHKDANIIRAGFGISICHIGMEASELGAPWEKPNPDPGRDSLHNRTMGIDINLENGQVSSVFFHFLSRDYRPFVGSTNKGITADSSAKDVRDKYGEPSYIVEGTQSEFGEYPGAHEIQIAYVEEGIDFRFVNDKLAIVGVFSPNPNFDYDSFERITGNSLIYIRPRDSMSLNNKK